jgi:AraC-type DNA-binding domain-containing proteins
MFGTVNYINTANIAGKQAESLQLFTLNAARDTIQNSLGQIKNAFIQIENRKWTGEIEYLDKDYEYILDNKTFDLYMAVKDIRSITTASKFIDSLGIYIKNSSLIIDNIHSTDSTNYFKKDFMFNGIELGKWYTLTDTFHGFEIFKSGKALIYNKPVEGIAFIQTIPPDNSVSKGFIFSFVRKEYFDKILNSLELPQNAYALIIDESNVKIANTGNYTPDIRLPDYKELKEATYINFDKKYTCYSANIRQSSWKLLLVISEPMKIQNEVFNYFASIINIIFIMFLLGLIIMYILSCYNYRPLNNLVNALVKNIKDPILKTKDEYMKIQNILHNIKGQEKYFKDLFQSNEIILKESMLYILLKYQNHENDPGKIKEYLDELICQGRIAFIIMIKVFSHENFPNPNRIIHVLIEYLQRLSAFCDSLYNQQGNPVLLVILSDKNENLSTRCNLVDMLVQYKNKVKKKYHVDMYFGIEDVRTGSIQDVIIQAGYFLKFNMFLNTYNKTDIDYPIYTDKISEVLPLKTKAQIIKQLGSGEFENIRVLIEGYFKPQTNGSYLLNANEAELLFHNLVAITLTFVKNRDITCPEIFNKFKSIENTNDILDVMKDICKFMELRNSDLKKVKNTGDLKAEMIAFIDANFQDHNMCLKLVKDKFNLSFSMITKLIQETTGYGFLDYLKRKRIAYAKTLLSDPLQTISKVGNQSGFNDNSIFIKTFKSYENITPGEYRQKYITSEKSRCKDDIE